jgi:hypothetical protein
MAGSLRETLPPVAPRPPGRPRVGQVIVFDEPLSFADGRSFQRLEVIANPRSHRTVLFSCVWLQQPLPHSQHQEPVLPARRSPSVSGGFLPGGIKGSSAQRRTLFVLDVPRGRGRPGRV